jgi:hypothetical protein
MASENYGSGMAEITSDISRLTVLHELMTGRIRVKDIEF